MRSLLDSVRRRPPEPPGDADAGQVRDRLRSLVAGDLDRPPTWRRPDGGGPRHARRAPSGGWASTRWAPGRRGAIAAVAALLLAAGVVAFVVWHSRPVLVPVASATRPSPSATTAPRSTAPTRIVVSVVGKVRRPGLVRLPAGSRVADAIAAAGGVLPGADTGRLNLAKVVADGEQVVVGLPAATPAAVAGSGADTGPVNLNTASVDQLDELPGVGPATAERIIQWRAANGPFTSLEQLQEVPGIGPAKYAEIAPLATV